MNLADLIQDAVDDVEPADRLDVLRARTSSPAHAARPWWWAAGGVVAATAATVAAFALVGDGDGPHDHGNHAAESTETMVVPAYFVGTTTHGDRLFREFDQVTSDDPLQGALERIQHPPTDPDYQMTWMHGTLESAQLGDGTIDVELGDVEPGFEADLAADDLVTQQVVYTLQGALGERLPVRFLRDGDVVLGPVDAAPELDVLNLVSISDPAEGTAYTGGAFVARGRASSFEATVPWELRDDAGRVVKEGSATAEGWEGRLYPWETEVDVSDLPHGFYTFVARTDDPIGGKVDRAFTDTRTIIVR